MNFDTFAIAAIATELRTTVPGGRVQRVTQINSLTYSFEIYVHPIRHYFVLSVEPQAPRMHLTLQKSRRGVGNETPLALVLRKYMRGAILKKVEQPANERLLYLHFDSPIRPTILAAEMLGTRSNLLLLDVDQTILGAARLSKVDSKRTLLPNYFYTPPPPQHKRLPTSLTTHALQQELNEASPQMRVAKLLPQVIAGVSPQLAREITFRATGSATTKVADVQAVDPLLTAIEQLFDRLLTEEWQPTLARDDDGNPLTCAPYPLTHLPNNQHVDTFSAAVETYFADAAASYAAAKAPLTKAIGAAKNRLARRRERLESDAAAQANPKKLKEYGKLILASTHLINPGQSQLEINWLPGKSPTVIKLDPALSPSENAQQYFNRYRKAQRAAEEIPAQLKKITLEEQYLEQLEQDLQMAENRPEIDTIAEALAEDGYYKPKRRRKRQKSKASQYLRLTAPGGATAWVGKNSKQNAHLTFNRAKPDDLWLHARGVPGAHVIIPTAEGLPSEEDVFWAASIAAHFSRARSDTAVEVDVTLKKHVRAIRGAAPGLVTYRNESTFRVSPEAPDGE